METQSKATSKRGRKPQSGKPFEDTRELLIRKGLELWTEKGFNATGLGELLKAVGVPKGSFYHYFSSKDDFALAVIAAYDDYFSQKLTGHFSDESQQPLKRLQSFIDDAKGGMQRFEYRRGCLVGNLGQEMASLDEAFRNNLSEVFNHWESLLESLLREAVKAGEMHETSDCALLSRFFWSGWEGAILRARLMRSEGPLTEFSEQFFNVCRSNSAAA